MSKLFAEKQFGYRRIFKYAGLVLLVLLSILIIWQMSKKVPTEGDWKDTLKVLSTAEFHGDSVTVKNVRNFQYDATGAKPTVEAYYDKTYDLNGIKKVWYVTVPFHPGSFFAHTFLSFEFTDGSFLAITIEGRLTKDQEYTTIDGFLHTYPLMYIAADERDVVYVRSSLRKNDVYIYPLIATPAQGRLAVHPTWYSSVFANCTSSIADHVNAIWPGLLPRFDWQALLTNYADTLVYKKGLIDTKLSLEEARAAFYVTDRAAKVGYADDFSARVRQAK
jgi:hypothetical protein